MRRPTRRPPLDGSRLTNPGAEVVTIDIVNMDVVPLQQEVLQLRRRVQKLTALLRVLLAVIKISGCSLSQARLPDGKDKNSLLRAIDRFVEVLDSAVGQHGWHAVIYTLRGREQDLGSGTGSETPRNILVKSLLFRAR